MTALTFSIKARAVSKGKLTVEPAALVGYAPVLFIMPSESVHQFNPSACQADFTYTMTPVAVEILHTGKVKKRWPTV